MGEVWRCIGVWVGVGGCGGRGPDLPTGQATTTTGDDDDDDVRAYGGRARAGGVRRAVAGGVGGDGGRARGSK